MGGGVDTRLNFVVPVFQESDLCGKDGKIGDALRGIDGKPSQ